MSISTSLQSMYTKLNTILSNCNTSLANKGSSIVSTLYEVPTAIDSIITGIPVIISNEDAITPTGTYANATYYDLTYGVKIGYMSNGDVMISMKNGTTTAYENLYFYAASLPDGVTLEAPSTFGTGNVVNMTFIGIIHGLTGSANIAIDMSTRNATTDYVRCDLTITYDS